MKKRIIASIYILLLLVCFKFGFIYIYNEYIIDEYNNNNYSLSVNPLLFCNWFQPYLPYYNMGNIHYQNGEYEKAIDEYKNALELNPGKKKECSVRINLALAIIKTMGEDYDSEEKVEASIAKLKEAREILLEAGCATETGNGHNETAEKLKREIDDMLDELEKKQKSEPEDDDNSQDKPEEKNEDEEYEKNIKDTLQQQQIDSYKERSESMESYEEFDFGSNFEADGRVW